jgi:glycosyltransferase involved in cell wall biosynthesis
MRPVLAFVSTLQGAPWGGSEELWSQAAARLAGEGFRVRVNASQRTAGHKNLSALVRAGGQVSYRPDRRSMAVRIWERWVVCAKRQWLRDISPDLVVISQGSNTDGAIWMKACQDTGYPYVTISTMAAPHYWPDDALAAECREGYRNAAACYFVAEANLELTRSQLAAPLPRAKIVRSPFSVSYGIQLPWPSEAEGVHLACVARLEPAAKGQDLLLQALSSEKWLGRSVHLTLYGEGSARQGLLRLKEWLNLERVTLAGFEPEIERVWRRNHLLVLPSRFEGLPISLVDAMLCGRPCIVTDVGGMAEAVADNVTGFVAAAPTAAFLDEALERAWQNRFSWRRMGEEAARSIRRIVPADPAALFSQELIGHLPP